MEKEFKKYLCYYFYEYITSYVRDSSKYRTNSDYKKFVAKNIVDYLGLNIDVKFLYPFICLLSKIQIIISLPIVFVQFVRYVVKYICIKRVGIENKKLVLDLIGTQELFEKISYTKDDLMVVRFPFGRKFFDDTFNSTTLLEGVNFCVLIKALILSVRLVFFQFFKYGRRDLLFRNYASYDFFVACFFFQQVDSSNQVVFTSTYDKWAYLFASLDNYKIFVQHGYLARTMICKKIGWVDECYCLNKEQIDCCVNKLFCNVPSRIVAMKEMRFTSQEKIINNGKHNILVIGNHLFQDIQESTVRELFEKAADKVNVYIKPHPLDSIEPYSKIGKLYPDLIILEKVDFPKVDVVISYESTLAYEYNALGVPAVFYEKEDFYSNLKMICEGNFSLIK